MIKAVLDTNVFISGFLNKDGMPAQLLKKWQNDAFIIVASPEIIAEIKEVLNYPKIKRFFKKHKIREEDLNYFFSTFEFNALVVSPKSKIDLIKEDPSDNKFLECALDGSADYIVSGDGHLLKLKSYKSIKIFPVAEFYRVISRF